MYVQVSPRSPADTAAQPAAADPVQPDPASTSALRSPEVPRGGGTAWRPRIGANHLMKGPQGVYYLRLTIPERVRELNPGLPKELKRSTLQAEKRAALAQARQMCVDFVTSLNLPKEDDMLVSTSTDSQAFTIHYVDGGVDMKMAPNAKPETAELALRIMQHVYTQVLGRTVRHPVAERQHPTPDLSLDAALQVPPVPQTMTSPTPAPVRSDLVQIRQEAALDTVHAVVGPASRLDARRSTLPVTDVLPSSGLATAAPAFTAIRPIWLFDAIQLWRSHDGISFSDETWRHSYSSTFRILRELLGNERRDITLDDGTFRPSQLDRRIDTLSRADIELLYEQLKLYPSRQGKRLDDIEAPARIEIARTTKQKLQSPANVDKLLDQVSPFMAYMADKGWVSRDLCWELKLQKKAAVQRANKAAESKPNGAAGAVALTLDELKKTFEQPAYLDGAARSDWAYFVDPIRLYAGPRVSEVAQLYIEDIVDVEGVPCFSFAPDLTPDPDEDEASDPKDRKSNKRGGPQTEAEFRRLKNKASRRIVPIHPALIDMGFLDFVESRRNFLDRGDALLFPGLSWHSKSGYGRKPSEHTLDLLKKAGVWQYRRKVGHSLRSNAAQEFKRVGMDPDLIQRVLGHSTGKLHDSAYGKTDVGPALPVHRVLEFMRKTDFGVTFPRREEMLKLQVEYAQNKQAGRRRTGD